MIELRSDTFTLPTEAMRQAISRATLGDDVYGEDPTVCALEELAAHKLGKEAACLMPSGTMANLAAIMAHCPRGTKTLVGNESDIFIYEAGGASVCGGITYDPIPTQSDGQLLLREPSSALRIRIIVVEGLFSLSNTCNRSRNLLRPDRSLFISMGHVYSMPP
jgi:threonine aldolase